MRGVVVVTGATSGIGLAAAVEFARRGEQVALVGRDPGRLSAAADRVRDAAGSPPATFRADFAVLHDVRELAERLRSAYPRISVLANNAGTMVFTPTRTVDGFELSMQANHLAPVLLTALLRDRVERAIFTASAAHRAGTLDPANLNAALVRYRPMRAYGTSKQAIILFAAEAARRWRDPLLACFHPGVVRTRFGSENRVVALGMRLLPGIRTPARGADTLIWLAYRDRGSVVNGGYYADRKLLRAHPNAADPAIAAELFEASLAAIGLPADDDGRPSSPEA